MSSKHKLSVLLVEDEQTFRQGLRTLLSFYRGDAASSIEFVGEAATVEQAIALTVQQHPALILLDLELTRGDGITVLRQLRETAYAGKVLVLSAHQEDEWIFKAMQAGAKGYVFKSRVANQLYEAIATVTQGEIYLPKEVASGFFRLFQASANSYFQARQQLHLTERELEVLQWLLQGAGNEEIAKKLYITVATVKAHLTSIFEKLSVTSRTQAIVAALKFGLVAHQ